MPEKPRTAHPFVKVLVIAHLIAIVSTSLPRPPAAVRNGTLPPQGSDILLQANDAGLKQVVKPYLMTTGFWQFWDMFSPNPATIDIWGDATITFRDGTTRRWQYPRMYLLPIPQKYVQERFRKFYERASQDSFSYLWPAFARRVARLNFDDRNNPPVEVALTRHWQQLPKPGQPLPKDYSHYTYFRYRIEEGDLP